MAFRHKSATALLVALVGCSRVGVPTPQPRGDAPEPLVTVTSLSGIARLGGQRLRVVIGLTTDARGRGTGHLQIPDLGLTADGNATWRDDRLELDLRYADGCPGELRIRGKRTPEGGSRVEGTLEAKDCTGDESGTVFLEVTSRTSGPAPDDTRVESAAG
ncbi:MAG TPA: hypothetical protein VLA36_10305, partial [Longimicrobiales bacterium]|nr:hypothetical protein [Longimicrobiales bacterium]